VNCEHESAGAAVFDIGGTWFRSAVYTEADELIGVSRRPALSHHHDPDTDVVDLQEGLVHYLEEELERLQAAHGPIRQAAISMGAALNARDGFVFNSGPLWGAGSRPIDLRAKIQERTPGTNWQILNDVTAALLRHVCAEERRDHGRTALITISTGIACRVYDYGRRCVPTDPTHGLQGEIGHLDVRFRFRGTTVPLNCDCGRPNHLNAFTSGRGLEAVVQHLATVPNSGFATSSLGATGNEHPHVTDFLAAVLDGDAWSREVLSASCQPLARILVVMLTHDPEIDSIPLVGGVAAKLGEVLRESLLEQLEELGMYQITDRDPNYFRSRVHLGSTDDDSGLIGCGRFLRHSDATDS
jgi:2-epi-5-epi-valiolone 7-kinase